MYIQQIYTNCLAQAAYYVESEGEAIIIDPLRESEPYLKLAESRNAQIKYVLETHFHADFVSGHMELASKTGAVIVYGPNAKPKYKALIAQDAEIISLGKIKVKVLHTPGHTLESSSFLLIDETGKENCVFTGDTLFIGDVGRPDLLSGNLGKEDLASMLYDSLNKKIKTLADDVIVYPGHGAGSACGKNIGKETVSTIGEQKKKNYALQNITREEFIKTVTEGLPVPPAYFFKDAGININGYENYDTVIEREMKGLSVEAFKKEIEKGAMIIDTRPASIFGAGFIPGSINLGLNGDFAIWVGTLIDFNKPILLVTSKGEEKESITRLARIGYDNVRGYLEGGVAHWIIAGNLRDTVVTIDMKEVQKMIQEDEYTLLDVRKTSEAEKQKIKNSKLLPLSEFQKSVNELNKHKKYIVYCAGGYRSMIAASIMKANGIDNVYNVQGGINNAKQLMPEAIEEFA